MSLVTSEFVLSAADFDRLRSLVREHTGIVLNDSKREFVHSRISQRLRELRLGSFAEYCDLLASPGNAEQTAFVSAVTTNLTAFFREKHHFDFIAQTVIPELEQHFPREKRIRCWSAACSTGEEPYSLVITLFEHLKLASQWHLEVVANDIDKDVLMTAANGIYPERQLTGLSEQQITQWFNTDYCEPGYKAVNDALRRQLTLLQFNLLERWRLSDLFDIIFCRNTLIYFDRDTQNQLVGRFKQQLKPGGYLFLGHSESMPARDPELERIGPTIYRRSA